VLDKGKGDVLTLGRHSVEGTLRQRLTVLLISGSGRADVVEGDVDATTDELLADKLAGLEGKGLGVLGGVGAGRRGLGTLARGLLAGGLTSTLSDSELGHVDGGHGDADDLVRRHALVDHDEGAARRHLLDETNKLL